MPIRFNPQRVLQQIERIRTEAIPGAARRAMLRSLNSGKVAIARDIASDMGLKVGAVKDEIRVDIVDDAVSGLGFVGRLTASGTRMPLIDFSAKGPAPSRGRGRGVTANTGHGRQSYPGAFIAKLQSGHRGVFQRVGASARKSRGAWSPNLPIVELRGPSSTHVFVKKTDVAIARFNEQFPKDLQREVSFALKKVASS